MALFRQPWFLIIIGVLTFYTYTVFKSSSPLTIQTSKAEAKANDSKKKIKKIFLEEQVDISAVEELDIAGFESMDVSFVVSENQKMGLRLKGKGRRFKGAGDKFQDWLELKTVGGRLKIHAVDLGDESKAFSDLWSNGEKLNLAIMIPANKLFNAVELALVSGDVQATGLQTKKMKVAIVSGDISLDSGRADELTVESVTGDVMSEKFLVHKATIKSVSGDINMRSTTTKPNYTVQTVSGDFHLSLPKKSKIGVTFESISGELVNSFKKSSTIEGEINISSLSGDARIERIR